MCHQIDIYPFFHLRDSLDNDVLNVFTFTTRNPMVLRVYVHKYVRSRDFIFIVILDGKISISVPTIFFIIHWSLITVVGDSWSPFFSQIRYGDEYPLTESTLYIYRLRFVTGNTDCVSIVSYLYWIIIIG